MPPHMHLKIIVSIEGFRAKRARELSRADEDLRWGGNPELTLAGDRQRVVGYVTVEDFPGARVRREGMKGGV